MKRSFIIEDASDDMPPNEGEGAIHIIIVEETDMKVGKKGIAYALVLVSAFMAGCSENNDRTNYKIRVDEYDEVSYETYEVKCGDISQELNFTLSASVMESVTYYPPNDDMKIKSFNYALGDVVNSGDLILEYDNDSLDDKIRECEDTLEKNKLLVDHYSNLIELGDESCTERDIEKAKDQIAVSTAFLEELNAEKEKYNVIAKGRGVVSSVSSMVDYGSVNSNDQLFTVVYGDGMYYVYLEKDCGLKEGMRVTGVYGVNSFELDLVSITPGEGNQSDMNKYEFEYVAVGDEIPPYSSLDVTLQLDPIKNVLYVPEETVYAVDDDRYVIVVDENGFGNQRKVAVASYVNGRAIITEGLSEKERVMIK